MGGSDVIVGVALKGIICAPVFLLSFSLPGHEVGSFAVLSPLTILMLPCHRLRSKKNQGMASLKQRQGKPPLVPR